MAIWQAKCWLGPKSGYQTLVVRSNTYDGAKQQMQSIYGAQQVIILIQVSDAEGVVVTSMSDAAAFALFFENMFKLLSFLFRPLLVSLFRLAKSILGKSSESKGKR